jgi:hypothetical protein
MYWQPQTTKT